MMAICVGFFDDKYLRIFRVTESIIICNTTAMSVSEIFYKCKNDYNFFDALDGSRLMAQEELSEKIDLLLVRDAQRLMERGISVLDNATEYEVFIKDSNGLFEKATNGLNVNAKLATKSKNSLRKLQMEVKSVEKAEGEALHHVKRLISKDFTNYATSVNDGLMDTAENSITTLIDMSPRCDSIMLIWNDIGWYMCRLISRPLSGIWIAVVIAAFCSILIYEALFDVAKYLKSLETPPITSIEPESTLTAIESEEPKSLDVRSTEPESTLTAIESEEPMSLDVRSTEPKSTLTATESKEPKSSDVRSSSMSTSIRTARESTIRMSESSTDVSTEMVFFVL
ncbi:hypothetical protein Aduo_007906 [Ancylostoma duodenale]